MDSGRVGSRGVGSRPNAESRALTTDRWSLVADLEELDLKKLRWVAIVGGALCLLIGLGHGAVTAQAEEPRWSEPVNLSRSGAAEAPALVIGAEGQRQVFWWDRFDGLMTSYVGEEGWSAPVAATLETVEVLGEGGTARTIRTSISAMPQIENAGEYALALWSGTPAQRTGFGALLYSRLRLGTATWTSSEMLTESVLSWSVARDPAGVVHLVYIRPTQSRALPAGIYYRRSTDGGERWSAGIPLYTSLYTRLWPEEEAHLSVAADGRGSVLVGWDDPERGRAFSVRSEDGGDSWGQPGEVGDVNRTGRYPHFLVVPASAEEGASAEFLLLWEPEGELAACTWIQQRSGDGGESWSPAERGLEGLASCPDRIGTAQLGGGELLANLEQSAGRLLMAVWKGEQWSEPKPLSVRFEHPESGLLIDLAALETAVTPDNLLLAVGQGSDGEIWTLQGRVDALEWAYSAPSPWSAPSMIFSAEGESAFGRPAVATDAVGRVHVLWSVTSSEEGGGAGLSYSRGDGEGWSRPTTVLGLQDGGAQAPALAFSGGQLHAVWNEGARGMLFYSRAYPAEAHARGSWSTPLELSDRWPTGVPAILADPWGRLHVAYAVPLNEHRGIYYTRSDDHGTSWLPPVQVFDAVIAGWSWVDHASVGVDEWGTVHVAWTRAAVPGWGRSEGVYYAQSVDNGLSWTDALLLAEGPYDWPQVGGTLTGQVLVTWQDPVRETVQYRLSDDHGETWGYVSQVPGLQTPQGRINLVGDGAGRLHLTACVADGMGGSEARYLQYAEGGWSLPELIEGGGGRTEEAVLFAAGESGLLDVIGLEHRREEKGILSYLWQARRRVEPGGAPEIALRFEPTPESVLLSPLTPEATLTPRPVLNAEPPPSAPPAVTVGPASLPLLALGGIGVVLLLVGAVVVGKAVQR